MEIESLTGLKNLSKEQIDFKIDEEEMLAVMKLNPDEVLAKATSTNQENIQKEKMNLLD